MLIAPASVTQWVQIRGDGAQYVHLARLGSYTILTRVSRLSSRTSPRDPHFEFALLAPVRHRRRGRAKGDLLAHGWPASSGRSSTTRRWQDHGRTVGHQAREGLRFFVKWAIVLLSSLLLARAL